MACEDRYIDIRTFHVHLSSYIINVVVVDLFDYFMLLLLLLLLLFICTVIKMASHNETYMQDNKATSAALTGAL